MQIKQLTIWRSTFYARDFLSQPPMLSFKELIKVYYLICNLCYTNVRYAHGELACSQQALDPMAEARGLRAWPAQADRASRASRRSSISWMAATT